MKRSDLCKTKQDGLGIGDNEQTEKSRQLACEIFKVKHRSTNTPSDKVLISPSTFNVK